MYITNRYWEHYIGDTDDSLTLLEHLAEKQKTEIPLGEIIPEEDLPETAALCDALRKELYL